MGSSDVYRAARPGPVFQARNQRGQLVIYQPAWLTASHRFRTGSFLFARDSTDTRNTLLSNQNISSLFPYAPPYIPFFSPFHALSRSIFSFPRKHSTQRFATNSAHASKP